MKQYTVYLKQPIATKSTPRERWNPETKQWYEIEPEVEMRDTFTFYRLASAKRFIKQNLDNYKGSSITKTWANGDWENLGEIKLTGNNTHFIANTRQKKAGY